MDDEITLQEEDCDPRQAAFPIHPADLSNDAVDGLIDEYCFRLHGLNETEAPDANRERVRRALADGKLVIWFDPVENTAALSHPTETPS